MSEKNIRIFYSRKLEVIFYIALIISSLLLISNDTYAKSRAPRSLSPDVIAVFPDFPFHQQFVRENITFVNYVRDRELAEVHVMMTRYVSGSAGENYVISFIGRNRFEGINNVITYWAPGTNTVHETRNWTCRSYYYWVGALSGKYSFAQTIKCEYEGRFPDESGSLWMIHGIAGFLRFMVGRTSSRKKHRVALMPDGEDQLIKQRKIGK
jgi:hypothetical protein